MRQISSSGARSAESEKSFESESANSWWCAAAQNLGVRGPADSDGLSEILREDDSRNRASDTIREPRDGFDDDQLFTRIDDPQKFSTYFSNGSPA